MYVYICVDVYIYICIYVYMLCLQTSTRKKHVENLFSTFCAMECMIPAAAVAANSTGPIRVLFTGRVGGNTLTHGGDGNVAHYTCL